MCTALIIALLSASLLNCAHSAPMLANAEAMMQEIQSGLAQDSSSEVPSEEPSEQPSRVDFLCRVVSENTVDIKRVAQSRWDYAIKAVNHGGKAWWESSWLVVQSAGC